MSYSDTLLHPVTISQVMINFAARQGVDRQTCLLGTGIAEEDLQVADGLITRAQEMRLIENLILALPDMPALGFRIGRPSVSGASPCAPAVPCGMPLH